MADTKISAGADPGTLTATDKVPMARSASTTPYAATVAELAAFANAAYAPNYSAAAPAMDGAAAPGVATTVSRGDHIHPTDLTRVSKAGDTMSGPLTLAANPAADMQAATRQYVDTEIGSHIGGGVTAIYYNARSTAITATDPGSGHVGFNTTAQGTATELYISGTSSQSVDWSIYWRGISAGTRLVIQRQTDSTIVCRFTLNAVAVDHGGWLTLAVTPYGTPAGFPVANNASMIVAVVTVGGNQFVAIDGSNAMTAALHLPGLLFSPLPVNAANDAAAAAAGVAVGGSYRSGSILMVRVV